MTSRTIRVDVDHLALLRAMKVVWVSIEAGGPAVSPETPYGSEDIEADVLRILPHAAEPRRLSVEALLRLPILVGAGELSPDESPGIGHREIAALRALRMELQLDPEALPINIKRPYGDMTAFEIDLAEAVGIAAAGAGGRLSRSQTKELFALHESLERVLQTWLRRARFTPGDYAQDSDGRWRRVDETTDRIAVLELTQRPGADELVAAIKAKDLTHIERLLARCADPEATDTAGHTPMIHAAAANDVAIVKLLLRGGAEVNARQGKWKASPLIAAAMASAVETFDLLRERGASLAIRSVSETSPLGYAVLHQRDAIVQRIAAAGWTEPGALGVQCYGDEELAEVRARIGPAEGPVVKRVVLRSTADRLGLEKEDAIELCDGVKVTTVAQLASAVRAHAWRETVHLTVVRRGERIAVSGPVEPRIGEGVFKF
jgi:hypothetical protein